MILKIAAILPHNPFFVSSASANRWRTMIEGLANLGIEMHLIVLRGYQSKEEFKELGFNGVKNDVFCHYTLFMLNNSLAWRRLSRYILLPVLKRVNSYRANKLINEIDPDILFIHPSLEVFEVYISIRNKQKHPRLLMTELNEFEDVKITNAYNQIQRKQHIRSNDLLINDILPSVNIFLVMTQKLLKHYQSLVKNTNAKFFHLPMTVDLKRFSEISKQVKKEPYVMYLGAMGNNKDGVDILIKAFSKICNKFPKHKLILVGPYSISVPQQKLLIKQLALEDRILYLGEKHRDEVPQLLSDADLLVLPRPDSRQAQGGFPTKLGEYLATANPVCVTKVGEIPDYLDDEVSAFLAVPGDIDSFADAMERALGNKQSAKEVGQKGKEVAEKHFNMEIQAKRLYEFLLEYMNTTKKTSK